MALGFPSLSSPRAEGSLRCWTWVASPAVFRLSLLGVWNQTEPRALHLIRMWGPAGPWSACLLLPFSWDLGGCHLGEESVWRHGSFFALLGWRAASGDPDLFPQSRENSCALGSRAVGDPRSPLRAPCGHCVTLDKSQPIVTYKMSCVRRSVVSHSLQPHEL